MTATRYLLRDAERAPYPYLGIQGSLKTRPIEKETAVRFYTIREGARPGHLESDDCPYSRCFVTLIPAGRLPEHFSKYCRIPGHYIINSANTVPSRMHSVGAWGNMGPRTKRGYENLWISFRIISIVIWHEMLGPA